MPAAVEQATHPGVGPRLLTDWEEPRPGHWARIGAVSVLLNAALLLLVGRVAVIPGKERSVAVLRAVRITPLVGPSLELTQTDPNRGPLSREFNVESIRPSRASEPRQASPGTAPPPLPVRRKFAAPAPRPATPSAPTIDAPEIDTAQLRLPTPLPQGLSPLPPPKIEVQEKPKIAFETPGAPAGVGAQRGAAAVPPAPKATVDEAVRQVARGGAARGLVVGDEEALLAQPPGPGLAPSPGRLGSALELKSDPMGVDFRPYLIQVLSAVRRNWFAVIPESAKLGRPGKVVLQFAIGRNGVVEKLVFAQQSGTEAFDRAAVAGISASNPFPPLPAEYRGNQIRLQLTFLYNMR